MWFLYFWGISTIACLLILWIIGSSITKRIKRDWNYKNEKTSFSEFLAAILPFLIPFINCLMILICIFIQEELYKKVEKKQIERGATRKEKSE